MSFIAQVPYISPYISKINTNLIQDLNCDRNAINIKLVTTEKLGFIGRAEGIACEAVALLVD